MYAQLRVYTVNKSMMDEWVPWFYKHVLPAALAAGQKVIGPWQNEAKTEFIWLRVYDSAEDAKVKDAKFYDSPAWKAASADAGKYVAKANVTIMTSLEALTP